MTRGLARTDATRLGRRPIAFDSLCWTAHRRGGWPSKVERCEGRPETGVAPARRNADWHGSEVPAWMQPRRTTEVSAATHSPALLSPVVTPRPPSELGVAFRDVARTAGRLNVGRVV